MTYGFERRQFKRCSVKVPLTLKDDKSVSDACTFDISLVGVCAQSKIIFPLNSKVYLTLSIPTEEVRDVAKVNVIGEVLRVHEVASENGYSVSLGILFNSICEKGQCILRGFIKKRFKEQNGKKAAATKAEKNELQATIDECIDVEVSPCDTSQMSFIERLNIRGGYVDLFVNAFKWAFKIGFVVLFFYVCYSILLLIMDIINLR
jgi:hypothetical protein